MWGRVMSHQCDFDHGRRAIRPFPHRVADSRALARNVAAAVPARCRLTMGRLRANLKCNKQITVFEPIKTGSRCARYCRVNALTGHKRTQ